jgi:hypothetical protein
MVSPPNLSPAIQTADGLIRALYGRQDIQADILTCRRVICPSDDTSTLNLSGWSAICQVTKSARTLAATSARAAGALENTSSSRSGSVDTICR